MDGASDGELVRLIASGDDRAGMAETALCQRFAPRIRLYGLRHLRDAERTHDLVQTVLLGLLKAARAGRIDDLTKVEHYVFGTCRNAVQRIRSATQRAASVADAACVSWTQEPFEIAETGQLLRCLEGLGAREKVVVLLSFQEERSADEIARQLSTSVGNVRVLRHRALRALRRCLDRDEEDNR